MGVAHCYGSTGSTLKNAVRADQGEPVSIDPRPGRNGPFLERVNHGKGL